MKFTTGKNVQIMTGGTPIPFEDEELITEDGHLYFSKDPKKSVWDITKEIKVVSSDEGMYSVNAARGEVYFYTKDESRVVKVSGFYQRTKLGAYSTSASISAEKEEVDVTIFGDPNKQYLYSSENFSGTIDSFYVEPHIMSPSELLNEKIYMIITIGDYQYKYWAILTSENISLDADDFARQTVDFRIINDEDLQLSELDDDQKKNYKIEYFPNGGEGDIPKNEEVEEDTIYTIKNNELYKEDEIGNGWIDEKGKKYNDGDKITIKEDKKFTANFKFKEIDKTEIEEILKDMKNELKNTKESVDGKNVYYSEKYITLEDKKDIEEKMKKIEEELEDIKTMDEFEVLLEQSKLLQKQLYDKIKNGLLNTIRYKLTDGATIEGLDTFKENSNIDNVYSIRNIDKEIPLYVIDSYNNNKFKVNEKINIEEKEYDLNMDRKNIFVIEEDKENNIYNIKDFNHEIAKLDRLIDLETLDKNYVIYGNNGFNETYYDGTFPQLDKLIEIKKGAFRDIHFNRNFPQLSNLKHVGDNAFGRSFFEGPFPQLNNLEYIGKEAFQSPVFVGPFPQLNNLEHIGRGAFLRSVFVGPFPQLNNLEHIGTQSFRGSTFDNIPNDFYPGWDGKSAWTKPEVLLKKYVVNESTIYTPGVKLNSYLSDEEIDKKVEEILKNNQWPVKISYIKKDEENEDMYEELYEDIFIANHNDTITVKAKDTSMNIIGDKEKTIKVDGSKTVEFIVE